MKFLEQLIARGDTCQHLFTFSKHNPFQPIELVSKAIAFYQCLFTYPCIPTYISCIPVDASWVSLCLVGTYASFL